MRFTLAQIEAFYWTVRLGTVREAAERLFVTQPSLSLRLRELERILGVKLFSKVGRNIQPTPQGRALLQRAEQVLRLGKEIEDHVAGRTQGARQLIRLGVVDTIAVLTLSDLLETMEQVHSNISFEIHVGFSRSLSELLDQGRLDVALLTNPAPDSRLEQHPIAAVPVTWMVSAENDMPARHRTPHDLCDMPIFTNPAPSHLYDSVHHWFQTAGIWPSQVNVCNTLAVMAQLASRRQGATLLPTALHSIDEWARKLVPVEAVPAIEPHHLFAVWPKAASTSGVVALVEAASTLVRQSPHYL